MNREQRKQRWSLTLLYSGVFFAIELIAVLITTGLSFLLTRLGVLDREYAAKGQKTFSGIAEKYLSFTEDTLNLGGICLVAGLGPENNRRRDGSYAYYVSEPVVENDAKGVAPFILCYTEMKRLTPA